MTKITVSELRHALDILPPIKSVDAPHYKMPIPKDRGAIPCSRPRVEFLTEDAITFMKIQKQDGNRHWEEWVLELA